MTEEAAAAVIKALEPSLQRMQGQMENVKMFKQVLGVSPLPCQDLAIAAFLSWADPRLTACPTCRIAKIGHMHGRHSATTCFVSMEQM